MATTHSPTEVVEEIESDEDLLPKEEEEDDAKGREMAVDLQRKSPVGRKATSKRGRNDGGSPSPDGSPEKRREPREDLPVSGRELRELLAGHLRSMKEEMRGGWKEMDDKIQGVAREVKKDREDAKVVRERVQTLEVGHSKNKEKIGGLEKEIEILKSDMAKEKNSNRTNNISRTSTDPWAQYLGTKGENSEKPPEPQLQGREALSEEDRRTLIVGGWAQDTKKATIIEEAKVFMNQPEVKALLDQDELIVWGPRRSFGALKFKLRGDESDAALRDRMWGVIKHLRAAPQTLPSTATSNGGVAKNMWIQFVKTKEARKRSSHCSLLRRLCLELARESQSGGQQGRPDAVDENKYECDWGAGTVWFGEWKVGSSSHRAPRGESIKWVTSGWVDVQAVANLTGITYVEALHAVEREINK